VLSPSASRGAQSRHTGSSLARMVVYQLPARLLSSVADAGTNFLYISTCSRAERWISPGVTTSFHQIIHAIYQRRALLSQLTQSKYILINQLITFNQEQCNISIKWLVWAELLTATQRRGQFGRKINFRFYFDKSCVCLSADGVLKSWCVDNKRAASATTFWAKRSRSLGLACMLQLVTEMSPGLALHSLMRCTWNK
jgi:hypothetical protein